MRNIKQLTHSKCSVNGILHRTELTYLQLPTRVQAPSKELSMAHLYRSQYLSHSRCSINISQISKEVLNQW